MQYVSFFVRQWKTSLVSVVESVVEIHCSTEGRYRQMSVWNRNEVNQHRLKCFLCDSSVTVDNLPPMLQKVPMGHAKYYSPPLEMHTSKWIAAPSADHLGRSQLV